MPREKSTIAVVGARGRCTSRSDWKIASLHQANCSLPALACSMERGEGICLCAYRLFLGRAGLTRLKNTQKSHTHNNGKPCGVENWEIKYLNASIEPLGASLIWTVAKQKEQMEQEDFEAGNHMEINFTANAFLSSAPTAAVWCVPNNYGEWKLMVVKRLMEDAALRRKLVLGSQLCFFPSQLLLMIAAVAICFRVRQ